jgi:hypothetical protein
LSAFPVNDECSVSHKCTHLANSIERDMPGCLPGPVAVKGGPLPLLVCVGVRFMRPLVV